MTENIEIELFAPLDRNGNPIQRGFYFDQNLLVFVSNPKSCLVEAEQENNFFPFSLTDFKRLDPIPISNLEKVAQQYKKISLYKANWIREYLESIRTAN